MHQDYGQPLAIDPLLEQLSRTPVPPEVEMRLRSRLHAFAVQAETATATGTAVRPASRWWFHACVAAGCAASVLLLLTLLTFGSRDAWAQVARSLRSKTWVRWTLKIPEGAEAPEAELAEAIRQPPQIWFSAANKVGAGRFLGAAQLVDFARGESYRYDPKEKTVYRESASDYDQIVFEHFDSLLKLVSEGGGETSRLARSPIEIVERTRREVREADRRWTEFTFKLRDPRKTPPDYSTMIRVDPDSGLPIDMTSTEKISAADKALVRTYVFDYPETGPADIYALGVPRTAHVVDWRSSGGVKELYESHARGRARRIEPYSAIVLMSDAQSAFSDVHTAQRVTFDGKNWQQEHVDLDQLLKFRMKVWSKEIVIPREADPAIWWKGEVVKLGFDSPVQVPPGSGSYALPDTTGYFELGHANAPGGQAIVVRNPTTGPPNTVLLTVRSNINTNHYWMDPAKDHRALRFEFLTGDATWKIGALVIDKLERSPGGYWYVTESRVGHTKNSGDDLPVERNAAPVTTSVYRYFVEFNK